MEKNTIYIYTTIIGYQLFNTFKYKYYSQKLAFASPQMLRQSG